MKRVSICCIVITIMISADNMYAQNKMIFNIDTEREIGDIDPKIYGVLWSLLEESIERRSTFDYSNCAET